MNQDISESRKIGAMTLWTQQGDTITASDEFTKILNGIKTQYNKEALFLATTSDNFSEVMKAFQMAKNGVPDGTVAPDPKNCPEHCTFVIRDHEFRVDAEDSSKNTTQSIYQDAYNEKQTSENAENEESANSANKDYSAVFFGTNI